MNLRDKQNEALFIITAGFAIAAYIWVIILILDMERVKRSLRYHRQRIEETETIVAAVHNHLFPVKEKEECGCE